MARVRSENTTVAKQRKRFNGGVFQQYRTLVSDYTCVTTVEQKSIVKQKIIDNGRLGDV